ncbi:Methyltransferase domain containing protein [Candidatus Pelagibacterales bacterium]
MDTIKSIFKLLIVRLSRIIYIVIPDEYKKSNLELKLNENLSVETFNHFKEDIKKSLIFRDSLKIREYAIKTALLNDKNKELYYLEFGVFQGKSANFFSKYIKKLYCFDSFEGLNEDWAGNILPKGYFNLNKKIPKLNSNIETVVGWVEETLEGFLSKHDPKINFVHLDMDLYSPTKFTLEKIKPYLVKNAIIIFDELYNHIGWENGEYKALKEVFKEDQFLYKAFTVNPQQDGRVVIQIK